MTRRDVARYRRNQRNKRALYVEATARPAAMLVGLGFPFAGLVAYGGVIAPVDALICYGVYAFAVAFAWGWGYVTQ